MRTWYVACVVGLAAVACSSKEDPSSYARKVADDQAPTRGPSQIKVFKAAVPRGSHVACDDLLDADALGHALGRPVALIDRWNAGMPANAACVVVDAKTAAEHRTAADRAGDAIGQTIGLEDAVCRIEAACYDPLDAKALERRCRREIAGGTGTTIGGVFACLAKQSTKDRNSKLMESGRVEHVKFQITAFEPDTTCQLTVYGLDDERRARACAEASVATITTKSIATYE